jgi:uncharacterized protein (DUF983 family)
MSLSSAVAPRSVKTGLLRGLSARCPDCGQGKLFAGYLKVNRTCSACGHATGEYRADDGPAYFTILLVGHLIIAPVLAFQFIRTSDPWLLVAISLPLLTLITLALLRVTKGGLIGVLWATRARSHQ